jgi:hypothetical protein
VKLHYFKRFLSLLIIACLLNSNGLRAADNKAQPDEAFLEFLASMTDVDGDTNDPLDMLDVESVGLTDSGTEIEKVDNSQLLEKLKPQESTAPQASKETGKAVKKLKDETQEKM